MKTTLLTLGVLATLSIAQAQGPATSSSDGMTGNPNYQTPNARPTHPGTTTNDSLDPNNINRNNPRLQRTTPGIDSTNRRSQNSTTGDAYNSLRENSTNSTGNSNLNTTQPGRQDTEGTTTNR